MEQLQVKAGISIVAFYNHVPNFNFNLGGRGGDSSMSCVSIVQILHV